ncbi:alpha/beta hydrolase [Streptomyces sp. SID9727]|uniref:alpha/beta hydrolase fold domain-containing protein n=1 Tax=Streptomyces sp. SID9727 TaxID=2706114 RepID=UPI0013C7B109|nr:alpha/beta hydrolase [Streptomyces sp. SID9727]
MPVGYLVPVLIVAIGTWWALRPVPWEHPLGRPSYFFGLAANELPFAAFFWMLLVPTVMAFAQDDVMDSPGAWGVVALAAVTAPGLAVIAHRAWGERDRIERAMTEGLGEGWRAAIDADLAEGLRRRPPWLRVLFVPVLKRRRDVRRVANLSYGDAGRRNLLDVYHHRARPQGAPMLIHMHGGGYTGGHKNSQSLPLLYRLASRGWVTISANYRLKPQVRHPEHMIDLKRVIAWAREHAQEYGADPSCLFVAGSSAGGHMGSIAALTSDDPAFQPGFEDADTSVSGVVVLNGFLGAYWHQGPESSPLGHARPDAPPLLIVHGDLDPLVPVAGIREVAEGLRDASESPVVYAELRGGHHAFDLYHSLRFDAVVDAVEAFTAWVRSRERSPRA